jgi:hypothetical protein
MKHLIYLVQSLVSPLTIHRKVISNFANKEVAIYNRGFLRFILGIILVPQSQDSIQRFDNGVKVWFKEKGHAVND